ncbi:MAG: hypothetical protein QOI35_810, partial [Cryptosporangiaceae bacterium]|nr:hypothetical protein [Cryptosporangiaceae bacterium]
MDPASAVAVLAAGGDLVAHEMACVLRDEGEQVALLAILDSYPRLPDARQVDYDEPQALAEVLHSLGLPQEPADGEPLTSETALKIVRSHAGALSTLNATQLSTVARIFTNNLNLQRRHDARFFDGDLLFFEAVAGKGADGERPTDWAPYVGGSVTSQ